MKIYAILNETTQHIGKQPEDSVEMSEERPTINHICQDNGDGTGTWVESTELVAEETRQTDIIAEQETTGMKNITPAAAKNFIKNRLDIVSAMPVSNVTQRAKKVQALIDETENILKKIVVYILK